MALFGFQNNPNIDIFGHQRGSFRQGLENSGIGNLLVGLTNPGALLGAIAMRQLARRRANAQIPGQTQVSVTPTATGRSLGEDPNLMQQSAQNVAEAFSGKLAPVARPSTDFVAPPNTPMEMTTDIRSGRPRALRGRAGKRNRYV